MTTDQVKVDVAAGERTLYPVDQLTQIALTKFDGDPSGRALVRLDRVGIELLNEDEWSEATDLLTGHTVAVRRADCGLGCKCAAEVKLVRYADEEEDSMSDNEREQEIHWAPAGSAPAKLVAGVNWWLNSDPDHAEDPVAMMVDNQDALILTGLNDVLGVAWVDPEGTVRELRGKFQLVHTEEDEEGAQ